MDMGRVKPLECAKKQGEYVQSLFVDHQIPIDNTISQFVLSYFVISET